MHDKIITIRDSFNSLIYKRFLKPIFFMIDPESIHDRMTSFGIFLGNYKFTRKIISTAFYYENKKLNQQIAGIKFKSPVGLAAGFDKNAQLTKITPCLGFGFEEVGSITGEFCEGNPRPRLWRLKKSKGLVVYYGLKNDGAVEVSERIKKEKFEIPVGISIAKTNNKETVDFKKGIEDYVKAYKKFRNVGSYWTINISCPNTHGGEPFTDPKKLDLLLKNINKIRDKKPIFLKISPDISRKNIKRIIELSRKYKLAGFICTNLSKKRNLKQIFDKNVPIKGGISGKVVEEKSNNLIRYIYKKTRGEFIIIGCGGIFSAEDAYKKIKSGANLVQLITGMIFEGPQVISQINYGLVKLLEKDNYKNISEAVGTDFK